MLDFEIYIKDNKKRVNFINTKYDRYIQIHKDKDTQKEYEYFNMPNIYDDKLGSFSDNPEHAFKMVKEGNGDIVGFNKIFGFSTINVLYFLDREYGEYMKNKYINEWKNVKFKYTLTLNSWSFSGRPQFGSDGNILNYNKNKAKYIETREEAEQLAKKYIEMTKELIEDQQKWKNENIRNPETDLYDNFDKSPFAMNDIDIVTTMYRYKKYQHDEYNKPEEYTDEFKDGKCLHICQIIDINSINQ